MRLRGIPGLILIAFALTAGSGDAVCSKPALDANSRKPSAVRRGGARAISAAPATG